MTVRLGLEVVEKGPDDDIGRLVQRTKVTKRSTVSKKCVIGSPGVVSRRSNEDSVGLGGANEYLIKIQIICSTQ